MREFYISIHAPRVGRDVRPRLAHTVAELISIHAPRVGRDQIASIAFPSSEISIHAPRVGRDRSDACQRCLYGISIHAPRVGRDSAFRRCPSGRSYFNPRAPCGARPLPLWTAATLGSHFNPRAPCGARRCHTSERRPSRRNFNPRAPCGARHGAVGDLWDVCLFQSTRPVWGATGARSRWRCRGCYFNPRAPCGARPQI